MFPGYVWLSLLRGWGSVTMAFIGEFIGEYAYYIYIYIYVNQN